MKLQLLQSCIDLPQLNDVERGLLRAVHHAIGTGTQMPSHLAQDVRNLFNKIEIICSTP